MKKTLLTLALLASIGVGSTFAATSCQSQLNTYRSLYVSEVKLSNTYLSMIKDTNKYVSCLWGVVLGEQEHYECKSNYNLYIASWNILYKYGKVSFKFN